MGPVPPDAPAGKILTYSQVLAYTYITAKFQLHSSINVRLTESSLYNRFRNERSPKWGFGVILGAGVKIFCGKVHPSSELHFFRHLWSRSDMPCSSILYGCSHLPQAKIWASLGVPSSPTRSRKQSPVPEGTPWDLRLPHGKIGIILRCTFPQNIFAPTPKITPKPLGYRLITGRYILGVLYWKIGQNPKIGQL